MIKLGQRTCLYIIHRHTILEHLSLALIDTLPVKWTVQDCLRTKNNGNFFPKDSTSIQQHDSCHACIYMSNANMLRPRRPNLPPQAFKASRRDASRGPPTRAGEDSHPPHTSSPIKTQTQSVAPAPRAADRRSFLQGAFEAHQPLQVHRPLRRRQADVRGVPCEACVEVEGQSQRELQAQRWACHPPRSVRDRGCRRLDGRDR